MTYKMYQSESSDTPPEIKIDDYKAFIEKIAPMEILIRKSNTVIFSITSRTKFIWPWPMPFLPIVYKLYKEVKKLGRLKHVPSSVSECQVIKKFLDQFPLKN